MSIQPSLALIPSCRVAGKLHSVLPASGAGDFSVSRNGSATEFNSQGLLQSVPANVCRFDFDPLTGEFRGVLVEPAAINLYSRNNISTNPNTPAITQYLFFPNEFGEGIGGHFIQHISGSPVNLSDHWTGVNMDLRNFTYFYLSLIVKNPSSNLMRITISTTNLNQLINFSGLTSNDNLKTILIGNNTYLIIINNTLPTTNPGQSSQLRLGLVQQNSTFTSVEGNFIFGGVNVFGSTTPFSLNEIKPILTQGSQVTRPADQIPVTVPAGATQCVYVLNGVQQVVPVVGGETFTLPNGHITQLYMI
jgi:hypothetical protein